MSCFFEQIGMAMIANSLPPLLIQGVLGGGVHGVAGNVLQKSHPFKCGKKWEIESAAYDSIIMYNLCHYIIISLYHYIILYHQNDVYINHTDTRKKNHPCVACPSFLLCSVFFHPTCRSISRNGLFSAFATVFGFSACVTETPSPCRPKASLNHCDKQTTAIHNLASGVSKGESSCHFGIEKSSV